MAILAFFISFPATALAQQPPGTAPAWDVAVTAGSFNGQATDDPGPG